MRSAVGLSQDDKDLPFRIENNAINALNNDSAAEM